jgi:hypothetical protein
MYPHFLVIGAQKAGTTWLDRNLRTHPQIWLPPEKEIHFFDLPRPLPFAALQYAPERAVRHWARHRLRRDLAKVERSEQTMEWYRRYYYAMRGWSWYRSLFTPGTGQICGEATPRYAVISRRKIASIRRRMPHLKIIYLLRDPIDRMWSDLAMFHDQRFGGAGTGTVSDAADFAFLARRRNLQHSRYEENLRNWAASFPHDQIFVGFLEEVSTQPDQLLQRIFTFLGVAPDHQASDGLVRGKINVANYPTVPNNIAKQLAGNLETDLRALHQRLQSPQTGAWLNRMEALLTDRARKEDCVAS